VWALASRESGNALEWMRSVLKENKLDASLSRGAWCRGPPLVCRTREVPSSVLVSISKLPFIFA